jgi:glycosyltransferase involved in cell wall biosynthesis
MKRRVSGSVLRSVQGFADEMVVVDTGSTDATVAIAEAAGARVEQIPWPGDFAPARNQALEFLNGDWVLVLDADEQLRPEAIPALKALMAQPDVLVINLLRYEVGGCHGSLFQRQSSVPPPPLDPVEPAVPLDDRRQRSHPAGRRTPMAHRRLQ